MALNISLYVNVEDMSFWIKYHFQKHWYVCFLSYFTPLNSAPDAPLDAKVNVTAEL